MSRTYIFQRQAISEALTSHELKELVGRLDDEDTVTLGWMMECVRRKDADLYSEQNRLPLSDRVFVVLLWFAHAEVRSHLAILEVDGDCEAIIDFTLPARVEPVTGIKFSNRDDVSVFNAIRSDALKRIISVGVRSR